LTIKEELQSKMKKTIILPAAFLATLLLASFPSATYAQQAPDSQAAPQTAPATQPPPTGESGLPMTKKELKAQRDQQKKEEKSAKASAKASRSAAKAKEDQDKALQSQEKAQPATPAPTPQK
jgi:hypothetical protein